MNDTLRNAASLYVKEDGGTYSLSGVTAAELYDIAAIVAKEEYENRKMLDSSKVVIDYLKVTQRNLGYEVFSALYLDASNSLIGFEELARGTIDQAAVYPREVVKAALMMNAKGVIFSHNHPSGSCDPSQEDIALTNHLSKALKLIGVTVVDHIVIGKEDAVSMAEKGIYFNGTGL